HSSVSSFSLYFSAHPRVLPSFPTRRSSDLTPADLAAAKEQNISILSYLANHFNAPVIAWMAPIIAIIAITKSFLGHYLGAREGRSEEHTSELQSRFDLVCRLLLEKKKEQQH